MDEKMKRLIESLNQYCEYKYGSCVCEPKTMGEVCLSIAMHEAIAKHKYDPKIVQQIRDNANILMWRLQ